METPAVTGLVSAALYADGGSENPHPSACLLASDKPAAQPRLIGPGWARCRDARAPMVSHLIEPDVGGDFTLDRTPRGLASSRAAHRNPAKLPPIPVDRCALDLPGADRDLGASAPVDRALERDVLQCGRRRRDGGHPDDDGRRQHQEQPDRQGPLHKPLHPARESLISPRRLCAAQYECEPGPSV